MKAGIPPYLIIHDWVLRGLVETVTCPAIVWEYHGVTQRRKFAKYGFPPFWLEAMISRSLKLPNPAPDWPSPLPDIADLPFLALAKASGAILVTGNVKHYPEAARHGVRVLTPAEYLQLLTQVRLLNPSSLRYH